MLALSLSLTSCGGGETPSTPGATGTTGSTPAGESGPAVSLSGAGASFPAPLYQTWFSEYSKQHSNIKVSYQSIGSGAGVKQFTEGTVDFGASDVAMTDEEIAKVKKGVLLLPMTAGAVVVAYNLPDVKSIKLSRDALADIFLGKITTWNDPKIAEANPGVNLPSQKITIVHRSDGSGTTATFTKYLSAISPAWKSGPGEGKTVSWPIGTGAKGNEGVTAQLQQTQGAIGYTEYGYATQQKIPFASLQNKAGKYVEANDKSSASTLESATLPENLRAFITDPAGADAYPIVTYTWILAYKEYSNADKAKALKEVLKWGLTDGQKSSPKLGYVPLPQAVVTKVQAAVDSIKP